MSPDSNSQRPPKDIPPHIHGTSKAYYDDGCRHPLCIAKARIEKRKFRARQRAKRILINGHLVYPGLYSADSDLSPRHGTPYAYRSLGCRCDPCKKAIREQRERRRDSSEGEDHRLFRLLSALYPALRRVRVFTC